MRNLAEGLDGQIQRNRELLDEYKKIPTGRFGAVLIDQDIKNAVAALESKDAVEMLKAYFAMRKNQ